jgi:hypothetical protein
MIQKKINDINPPGSYMQNTGIKCPDYWVNTGVNTKGDYICKNSFNIETNSKLNPKCNSNELIFAQVVDGMTWEMNNPNGYTSMTPADKHDFVKNYIAEGSENYMSRCDWIDQCGPSSSIQGVWSGVSDICNSPKPNN